MPRKGRFPLSIGHARRRCSCAVRPLTKLLLPLLIKVFIAVSLPALAAPSCGCAPGLACGAAGPSGAAAGCAEPLSRPATAHALEEGVLERVWAELENALGLPPLHAAAPR